MAKRSTSSTTTSKPDGPARPRAKKLKTVSTAENAIPNPEPSADEIRRRAYERYQQRGGNHGRHFDDWLEAEKELRSKK